MLPYEKQYYVLNALIFIILCQVMKVSTELEANVKLAVEGNGFHRNLIYQVDIKNFFAEDCYISIHVELPSALYANVEELADLRRQGITVCAVGTSDIELFAEQVEPQNVTACTLLRRETILLKLPVHQRYQYATKNGDYVNIGLSEPKLLLGCQYRVKDLRISKANLCSPCVELVRKWREIPYDAKNVEYVWTIPTGNFSYSPLITHLTLLITIITSILLIMKICNTNSSRQIKQD